ncbi:MAG TPA: hypothetical protein VEP90_30320, partial [Methylomirabilota bacterium]|nr:hypothetical protein [Methylomirabilota bacterium]
PGNTPFGTPNVDAITNCSSGNSIDNIGIEYMGIDISGTVFARTCFNSGSNRNIIESNLNPTFYTVFTVETYGVFCSTCIDNVFTGTSWVYFRIYQEDSNSIVISSTDKSLNLTSNISPLFQKSYAFVSQTNSNSATTNQQSYIDLVQVQNYGSPVCLFGCIPPLDLPSDAFSSLWATLVSFCQWVGFGDIGFGAFILFGIIESTVLAATYFVMNRFEGASTLVLMIEFTSISAIFLTSGLMGSIWLFAMLITDALVALLTFRAVFFSGSRGGAISE